MPFGIDDALIWGPMIGAALGGLTSKRDPLKGALLGGALGLGGGMMAGPGGLLGAAAAPAGGVAGGTGLTAAGSLGLNPLAASASTGMGLGSGLSATMPSLASPGLLATASGTPAQVLAANPSMFQQAMGMAKPIGNIASSANSVKGLLGGTDTPLPQVQPMPVATGQGGPQALASLVSGNAQNAQQIEMDAAQRKKRRNQLIGG